MLNEGRINERHTWKQRDETANIRYNTNTYMFFLCKFIIVVKINGI